MKKKILAMIVSLALIFNCGVAMAAQTSTVKEDKTVKVFIDVTALKTTNVPIIKDKKLMLSTELFAALGVSTKNQVWDKSKTKLTLTKGKTKLVLQLDSASATLNGAKKTLSVKPIKYKNKAYFPVDYIASCFDKQFSVDSETNTYFLKDKAEFSKNKKLFDNVLKKMNGVSKLKISENVTLSVYGPGAKMGIDSTVTTLADRKSKLKDQNMNLKITENDVTTGSFPAQSVLVNTKQYTQNDGGEWQQQDFRPEDVDGLFNLDEFFKYDTAVCSSLINTKGAKANEIVLKGNTRLGTQISSFMVGMGITPNKFSDKSFEVTLDSKTNIASKIVLKEAGITIVDGVTLNFTVNHVIIFSDINGSFEVIIPGELK